MSATPAAPPETPSSAAGWSGSAQLRFLQRHGITHHQGGASAPLKLMRSFAQASGHCELPLLHTAGGLVGGDQLQLTAELAPGSQALITTHALQPVRHLGDVGRRLGVEGGNHAAPPSRAWVVSGTGASGRLSYCRVKAR